ncbi:hypothetical protein C8F01DRAFT_947638, partial [Mycena amicta]
LDWSIRKGTKAAQKLPKDWEDQCYNAFLRRAYTIKEHKIPDAMVINSDQTGVIFLPGSRMTWTPKGSKQVAIVGQEEKRAFTAFLSVTASGDTLGIQSVFGGKTNASVPSTNVPHRTDCDEAGFCFVPSGVTGNHWSSQQMMQEYVEDILEPYLAKTRAELKLHDRQKALWIIDVWSVHRSKEFLSFMRNHHPDILIDFIPGGCT